MPLAAAALAAVLTAFLAYLFATQRERQQQARLRRAAALIAHEELWSVQNALAQALHDVPPERDRSFPGRWWTEVAFPDVRLDREVASTLALALADRGAVWLWVTYAYEGVRWIESAGREARVQAGSEGPALITGGWPGRLCETYLQLDVARRGLSAVGEMAFREHSASWWVIAAVPEVRPGNQGPTVGSAADLNVCARLAGRSLSGPESDTTGSCSGDWRDDLLRIDPSTTRLAAPYPWDRK